MQKHKTDAIRWLKMHGLIVKPCRKTQTIMISSSERAEWVDVFEYDWESLYKQCLKWNDRIIKKQSVPWEQGN